VKINACLQSGPPTFQRRVNECARPESIKASIPTVTILMCIIILFHNASFGVNPEMCGLYTKSASTAKQIVTGYSCKVGGPRWSSTDVESGVWCAGAKIESVADEAVGRLQDLNSCNHEAMCQQYANDVGNANQKNGSVGCGFSGPRYNPNINDSKNWCLSAKPDEVYSEERERFSDMDHCTTCDDYANQAEQDWKKQNGKGCQLSGPRWSRDRRVHIDWCLHARLSSVMEEKTARTNEANSCTKK
jgi:hypothetical protein